MLRGHAVEIVVLVVYVFGVYVAAILSRITHDDPAPASQKLSWWKKTLLVLGWPFLLVVLIVMLVWLFVMTSLEKDEDNDPDGEDL
jgi:NADH:ubiquinone oxidoreductase subunit 6 (subunit J)